MKTKTHSFFTTVTGEAVSEFKQAVRGPLIPLIFILLTLYMILVMMSADYMRQMGVVGISRNSAHLSYLMASGQSLWVLFTWAWLFSQALMRDRQASLSEMMLVSPVSLKALFVGRYLGALGVGLLLASAIFTGLASAPLLALLGILPADSVGRTPWASYAWAWLIFILPNAAGAGALYLSASLWTRDTRGAFIAAAAMSFIWMVAMIILKSGDVNPWLASVLDPSAYAEAERQADTWTPAEKTSGFMALTPQFLLNRFLWSIVPLILLACTLAKINREHLVLERKTTEAQSKYRPATQSTIALTQLAKVHRPVHWFAIMLSETRWHIARLMGGFGFRLAMVMLLLTGSLGSWVNFVQQVEGPLVAYPQALLPFLSEFFYIILVFILVGFLGLMLRRDNQDGFAEWVDAVRAPLAVTVIAKVLTGLTLIVVLCALPMLSSIIVTALNAPHAVSFSFPFGYIFSVVFPSLLELSAAIFCIHALVRSPGLAYTLSIFVAFIAIINHEVMLVEYPPGNFAIPPHADISELSGWSPWLAPLLAMAGFKAAIALLLMCIGWASWPRGTALTLVDRMRFFAHRLVGAAGVVSLFAVIIATALIINLNRHFIIDGEYQSTSQAVADNINWEKAWWDKAAPFSLSGGDILIHLNPHDRTGSVRWTIRDLHTPTGSLHGTLPHGVSIANWAINDVPKQLDSSSGDHLFLATPSCQTFPCKLVMTFSVNLHDWPIDDPTWLHSSGMWLTADKLLPTLGHDRHRIEAGPNDRKQLGLPEHLPALPQYEALAPLTAAAPAGDWQWTLVMDKTASTSWLLHRQRELSGPLRFATAWMPNAPSHSKHAELVAWHSEQRTDIAGRLLDDIALMQACVSERLGNTIEVSHIIQTPRHLGQIAMHDSVLWLPENAIWDIDSHGFGRQLAQFNLAHAMAKNTIINQLDMRQEPAALYLANGLAGWTALNCIRKTLGTAPALALKAHLANDVLEAFSAQYNSINRIDGSLDNWVRDYATLALDSWSAGGTKIDEGTLLHAVGSAQQTRTVVDAISHVVGSKSSEMLLGAPRSYDISPNTVQKGALQSKHWLWQDGGWQTTEVDSQPVSIQFDTPQVQQRYWLHDYPAFERTALNNVTLDK